MTPFLALLRYRIFHLILALRVRLAYPARKAKRGMFNSDRLGLMELRLTGKGS